MTSIIFCYINCLLTSKVNEGILEDSKSKGSFSRLLNFVWTRAYIKKTIMTIPYNSSNRSMQNYLADSLVILEDYDTDDKISWYSDSEKNRKTVINDKDIILLINSLRFIIEQDFERIKKLIKYLKNVAGILNMMELPITWTLPTGLTIKQSYLESKSTTITPFMYSKIKINLKTTVKDSYDKKRQVRALMSNLIHSLDGSSFSMLYEQFSNSSSVDNPIQFFSVHDCFGTTCDKVFRLKTILASVYTDLYSRDPYLYKFDESILDSIENNTNYKLDRDNRIVLINDNKYVIHDIDWVMNKKHLTNKEIKLIDSQHLLI